MPEGCDITGGATLAPEAAERRGLGDEETADGTEEAAPPLDSRPAERDLTTSGAPVILAEHHTERTSAPERTLGGDAPLLASPVAVLRGDGDSEGYPFWAVVWACRGGERKSSLRARSPS